jgi:hypothetical protein
LKPLLSRTIDAEHDKVMSVVINDDYQGNHDIVTVFYTGWPILTMAVTDTGFIPHLAYAIPRYTNPSAENWAASSMHAQAIEDFLYELGEIDEDLHNKYIEQIDKNGAAAYLSKAMHQKRGDAWDDLLQEIMDAVASYQWCEEHPLIRSTSPVPPRSDGWWFRINDRNTSKPTHYVGPFATPEQADEASSSYPVDDYVVVDQNGNAWIGPREA